MAIQAQLYNSENIGFPLGGSQDLMENACGFNQFYFNSQQQQYNQQIMQQQQQLQNIYQKNNQNLMQFVPKHNSSYAQTMPCSNSLTAQLEKQKFEIDRFISLQNERLRLTLQAQRKKETALILRKYGSKAEYLLKQKDEEIAKATNRTIELEDFLKRIEMENQTWQRMAKENEAMVMSLNNTIEQLRENICLSNRGAEDAESCCDEAEEDKTEHYVHNGHHQMMCKSCNSRTSCMIFLPCRHLCSCKDCDTFLHSCPVCKMVKKASIEALI